MRHPSTQLLAVEPADEPPFYPRAVILDPVARRIWDRMQPLEVYKDGFTIPHNTEERARLVYERDLTWREDSE